MLIAVDVSYRSERPQARAAAALVKDWDDDVIRAEYTVVVPQVAPYLPGKLFRRELPCIRRLLDEVVEPIDVILVDGYVWLGDRPGLGAHLWEVTLHRFPIVGVAKSSFRDVPCEKVIRGRSSKPLFVTAAGVDPQVAARQVATMPGRSRLPNVLGHVDRLARW